MNAFKASATFWTRKLIVILAPGQRSWIDVFELWNDGCWIAASFAGWIWFFLIGSIIKIIAERPLNLIVLLVIVILASGQRSRIGVFEIMGVCWIAAFAGWIWFFLICSMIEIIAERPLNLPVLLVIVLLASGQRSWMNWYLLVEFVSFLIIFVQC